MTDAVAGPTPAPDPGAEPGEKLSAKRAAERAGVALSTWYDYTTPRQSRSGRLIGPPPDGREEVSGTPWWYSSTIDTWKANRLGRGRRRDLTGAPATPPTAEATPGQGGPA